MKNIFNTDSNLSEIIISGSTISSSYFPTISTGSLLVSSGNFNVRNNTVYTTNWYSNCSIIEYNSSMTSLGLLSLFAPNLGNNTNSALHVGGTQSSYNCGSVIFNKIAAGSASNNISLGVYGSSNKATLDFNSTSIGSLSSTAFSCGGLVLSSTTNGLRVNRLTTTQRDALTGVGGSILFNTTTSKLNFYNGSAWEVITSA